MERTAVITGASQGLGLLLAYEAAFAAGYPLARVRRLAPPPARPVTARQHLSALLDEGLVAAEEERPAGRRGRPQLQYHTTELADAVFPKAYGALTNELLGYLADEDVETVSRLFARRRDHRIEAARARLDGMGSLKAKVDELARILDEDGYLATAEQVSCDTFRIVEHNCAIAAVAQRYGQACASELEFIRAVLPDAGVERVSHMVMGPATAPTRSGGGPGPVTRAISAGRWRDRPSARSTRAGTRRGGSTSERR